MPYRELCHSPIRRVRSSKSTVTIWILGSEIRVASSNVTIKRWTDCSIGSSMNTGWLSVWDIALCAAMQRCPTRRFTTYWAQRGVLTQKATDLNAFRNAKVLQIAGADAFFRDLDEQISALENFSASDPLSAQVA